ncbi:MAG: hypothetical protein Q8859_08520 [Bacteroidota bacterium]|nr:hypothetical protein [Bacteroidota bacterium]
MKAIYIILIMLFACISCNTNNKSNQPLSDSQKEKVKNEIKKVTGSFFKGCEKANLDKAIRSWLNSSDFVAINNNGSLSDSKEIEKDLKKIFDSLIDKKITIVDEKYSFIDNSTVIYAAKCNILEKYKDGRAVKSDPAIIQFTFTQINGAWMVINAIELTKRQIAKNDKAPKKLNQKELIKQLLGSWKADLEKQDTIANVEVTPWGEGIEITYKFMTKGKLISEVKELYGYDKNIDKFRVPSLVRGQEVRNWIFWFISPKKYLQVSPQEINNPIISYKLEGEFISPNQCIEKRLLNGEKIGATTYTKIK